MKNIFLTGSTGFLGQALLQRLLSSNIRVFALVRTGKEDSLQTNGNLFSVEGDLSEPEKIISQLAGKQIDTIYHMAWHGVNTDTKNNFAIQVSNLIYGHNVMKIAESIQCNRIIIPGSVSEYAYSPTPVNGEGAPSPGDFYAAAKASMHLFFEVFSKHSGLGTNWVLIPSVYGPGRTDNNLITYTICALLSGQKPIFTGLKQKWDYIYINDLIEGIYLVGEKGKPNTTYVIGGHGARELREYVEIIRDQIDPSAVLGIGELPYKTSSIDNSIVNISRLIEDTGYAPMTSFEDGIKKTIASFSEGKCE